MISRDLMIFLLSFWLREKINMNHIHIHTTYEHITNQTYKMNKWSISRHIDFVFLYLLLKDHDQWPWSEANAFGNWCNWINIHYFLIINAWCAPIYSMYQSPMSNYLLVNLMIVFVYTSWAWMTLQLSSNELSLSMIYDGMREESRKKSQSLMADRRPIREINRK